MQLDAKYRSDGTSVSVEVDADKNLLVSRGDLATAALAGRLYNVANQAAVAVTAGLATTWTGLGIANPAASGKNIIIHEFGWATDVVNPAEGVVGLMTSTDTDFAQAITARNCKGGSAAGVAYCDDGATIDTPVLERTCGSTMEGAISTQVGLGPNIIDLKGGIILVPGRSILTYHSIGGTASLIFHFVWEEVNE